MIINEKKILEYQEKIELEENALYNHRKLEEELNELRENISKKTEVDSKNIIYDNGYYDGTPSIIVTKCTENEMVKVVENFHTNYMEIKGETGMWSVKMFLGVY